MRILGIDYTIERGPHVHDSTYFGRHNGETMTIQVARCATRQLEESTMLHEMIEAINWRLELGLEHSAIAALEAGLYGALTDAGVELEPIHPDRYIHPVGRKETR